MDNYHELIMQWFERAKEEDEIFTKFIFLYISFNAFVNQARKEERIERNKIEFLKDDTNAKLFYTSLVDNDRAFRETINKLLIELNRKPIENSTDGRSHWIGENGKLRNEKDWENLVEYWYRVRNNLFHGHKVPQFPRDKRIATYAYLTLLPLMKNFVEHHLTWDFS